MLCIFVNMMLPSFKTLCTYAFHGETIRELSIVSETKRQKCGDMRYIDYPTERHLRLSTSSEQCAQLLIEVHSPEARGVCLGENISNLLSVVYHLNAWGQSYLTLSSSAVESMSRFRVRC